MVVEIVGTRTLAPVFGAGLFVWAALLAVTLCSLAAGYYTGGALADRHPEPMSLGVAIGGAAAGLAAAVVCAPFVLAWGLSHGPQVGSFLCALLLFGPALTALGMVGPLAVRMATTDVRRTGHRVGETYAISTAGSLVGTLSVVFVVIPRMETPQILLSTSGVLGVSSLVWLRRGWRGGVVALGVISALSVDFGTRTLPPELTIVERAHGQYGLLEVVDDSSRGIRLLRSDRSIIGGTFHDDGTSVFSYVHVVEALGFIRPRAKEMLQIGLGTGSVPTAMHRRGLSVDVVEIDPEVVRLAQTGFGYEPSGEVAVEDARTFLNRVERTYDFVVHDAFTGGVTPSHLLSQQVMHRIRELLRPRGVLVVNFPGFTRGPHAKASYAVARTIRSVFRNARAFRDGPSGAGDPTLSNVLFFASDGPIRYELPKGAAFENDTCFRTLSRLSNWEVSWTLHSAPLIRDAQNPLTAMQMPVAEAHFHAMAKLLPVSAWLPW